MYISRAIPRQDMLDNSDMLHMFKSSYAIHQAVWKFFPGDTHKRRAFLYRYDYQNGEPVVYIVSKEKPVSQLGMWVIESKDYAPCISTGDVLSFLVRVNPVVTRSFTNEMTGRSVHKRHDVIMDYKFRCREKNKLFSYSNAMLLAGVEWIVLRGEKNGFSVNPQNVSVDQYERYVFEKTVARKVHEAVIATIDLKGVLEVTDSELFINMLFNGLGPAKGFGCGLMMVKRFQVS